jgi:hypothetical protein
VLSFAYYCILKRLCAIELVCQKCVWKILLMCIDLSIDFIQVMKCYCLHFTNWKYFQHVTKGFHSFFRKVHIQEKVRTRHSFLIRIYKYKCCCNAVIEKLRAINALISDTLLNHSSAQVIFYLDQVLLYTIPYVL